MPFESKPRIGVWTEFLDPNTLCEVLPSLSRLGMHLHLGVHLEKDPSLYLPILAEARQSGVEVWAWPLLSESEGYWPNSSNGSLYRTGVLRLLESWESRGFRPKGISMDFEPSVHRLRALLSALASLRLYALWQLLIDPGSVSRMEAALPLYRELVTHLKSRGYAIHAVTTPFILRDLESSSWKIRSALDLPIDPELFDHVSFMAYRSEYERFMGPMGPELVTHVARRACKILGSKAGIDVGVAGEITFPHVVRGMKSVEEVTHEVAAARQEGISRVQIYSLEGLLQIGSDFSTLFTPAPRGSLASPVRQGVSRIKIALLNAVERITASFLPG